MLLRLNLFVLDLDDPFFPLVWVSEIEPVSGHHVLENEASATLVLVLEPVFPHEEKQAEMILGCYNPEKHSTTRAEVSLREVRHYPQL